MKLSLSKDLTPLRNQAVLDVDAGAGRFRMQFITTAPGQEMTYLEKRREAELFMAGPVPDGEIPHISREAAVNGISLFDQAVEYLTMAQTWSVISARIEEARMAAKLKIAAAKSPAEIEAAIPDWPALLR